MVFWTVAVFRKAFSDMDDGRVSDILHWQLMREGMQRKTGGTAQAANDLSTREVPCVELCWVNTNPAFRKAAGRDAANAAFLKVVRQR